MYALDVSTAIDCTKELVGAMILHAVGCCSQAETGFRTSAGISCSKMLAKLVSGMHKPDDQTVILPCHAAAFVATLPVRAIPGAPCSGPYSGLISPLPLLFHLKNKSQAVIP